MMVAHTKGPWTIGYNGYNINHIYGADGLGVATVFLPLNTREDEITRIEKEPKWAQAIADARLIAAAPDLLETLKAVLAAYECPSNDWRDRVALQMHNVRAAIAKATGAV